MSKEITNKTPTWDFHIHKILNMSTLNDMIKFHQSTTWVRRNNHLAESPDLHRWLLNTQYTDTLQNIYEKEIPLNINQEVDFKGSKRKFTDENLTYDEFSNLIYKSFGRDRASESKSYSSAGALYPVMPIIMILEENAFDEKNLLPGSYTFNPKTNSLRPLKAFSQNDLDEIAQMINSSDPVMLSKYCMGYAIDMKKSIAKYHRRGYRHALIEIGLAAQSFKHHCHQLSHVGEVCWSGFDDNAFSHIIGMNPRIAPVALIQWFGKYKENDS